MRDYYVFNQQKITQIEPIVIRDFETALSESCDGEGRNNCLYQFVITHQLARTVSVMGGIPSTNLVVRFPFLDYNVLDFFFRLPERCLWGQKSYVQVIRNYLPKAASVQHYVTGKSIYHYDNKSYLFLKAKEYLLRKVRIMQKPNFTSDTYDFKREALIRSAKAYVMQMIIKPNSVMETLFGTLSEDYVENLMLEAQAGHQKSLQQIIYYFNAAIIADTLYEKHDYLNGT